MLIAHLPAGYLLARRLAPRLARDAGETRRLTAVGLAAAMLPDIDMLWFWLVDAQPVLHHRYWTHVPAFWLAAAAAAALLLRLARLSVPWRDIAMLLSGVLLHLLLDSFAGGIAWAWPAGHRLYRLVEVPPRFDWWVWSFVLHWSFLAELAIAAWAAAELGVLPLFRDLKAAARARMVAGNRERVR